MRFDKLRVILCVFISMVLGFLPSWGQTPTLSGGPGAQTVLDENPVSFTFTLNNIGPPGYGPYIRLILEPGLNFSGATSFGVAAATQMVGTFPASPGNQLTDPVTGQIVTGPPGATLTILTYAVGSVVAGGPDLDMTVTATLDPGVTIGVPLGVSAQPVYRFGDTPTGTNGPIAGAVLNGTVTPTLFEVFKTNDAPEAERPPGTSWPINYTIRVDVADGRTIDNVIISDTLPADLQFLNLVSISGGAGCSATVMPSTVTPGGLLEVSCTGITGTAADNDLEIVYQGYIIDTLDETNCVTELKTNTLTADADFGGVAQPQAMADSEVTAKHVAIQKGISPDTGVPGQMVTFTLNIQVTDFGNAANTVITDMLPDGYTFGSHQSMTINGGAQAIVPSVTPNGDGSTTVVYDVGATAGVLTSGTGATISYTATVDQDYTPAPDPVLADDTLTNTVNLDYDMVEGATGCSDGSGATFQVIPVQLSKSIVNPLPEYVPGDVITYRLELSVPSGNTEGIVLEDFFPLPVHDVTSVSTTFGVDITTAPTDTVGLVPTSIMTLPATNSIRLEFPPVVSNSPEVLAVDVDIVVEGDPFADGLFLTNIVQSGTQDSPSNLTTLVAPVQFLVRAPVLEITKGVTASDNPTADATITPVVTPPDGDISESDAGDTVSFTITVQNTGGASAFDVTITDPGVPGLTLVGAPTVTDGDLNPIPFSGTLTGGLVLTNPLTADDMAAGGTDVALVTFQVTIDGSVNPNQVLSSTASAIWSSLSGAVTFPPVTDPASVTIARPTVAKTIDTVAPEGAGGGLVTSGDVITYSFAVTLPEGTTNGLTLTDSLPAGFEFLSAAVDTTGFVGSVDAAPTVNTGGTVDAGQTVTIEFDSPADTTVTGDNNAANNTFVVTLNARVSGASGSNAATSSTQNKNNQVGLTYTGITGGPITDNASIPFAEPDLSITKTMSPDTGLDAGDTITVTLVIENTGTAPAYDISISDTLNDDGTLLDLGTVIEGTTPGDFTYSYINPTVTYTLNSGSLAPGANRTFTFTAMVISTVTTGSSFGNTADVTGDSQDGVVTDERDTTDSGTDMASTAAVATGKTIAATSESWTSGSPNRVAIGEIISYQLVFDIPEGITLEDGINPIITDTLPSGFSYQVGTAMYNAVTDTTISGSNIGVIPAAPTAIAPAINGQVLEFDFGNLTVNDNDAGAEQIVFTYDVLVLNTTSNNRNNNKSNTARLNYQNRDGMPQSVSQQTTAIISEPRLTVNKMASPTTVTGGNTVTFTVVLGNTSGGNSARAWEPVLTDNLPARYQSPMLVSATLSRGAMDVSSSAGFAGNLLTADLSMLAAAEQYIGPGENLTVVYTATVDPTIGFEEQVMNTANARASSLPGNNGTGGVTPGLPGNSDGERTGLGTNNELGQAVNDLNNSDTATVTADRPTVVKTSDVNLQIGQTTTMTVSVGVPIGTTTNFVLTDMLPAGLAYTGDPINIMLPPSNFSNTNSPSTTPGAGTNPLVFDFGDVTNSAAMGQTITISYDVVVLNVIGNQNSTALVNTATLEYTGATMPLPSDTATVTVVEPNLTINKTVTAGAAGSDAGDTVSYQVAIQNTGTVGTAYAVDLIDILPPELLGAPDGTGSAGTYFLNIMLTNPSDVVVLNSDGVTPLTAGDAMFITSTNANDTLTWPVFDLPPSTTLTITYDVIVSDTANAGQMLDSPVTAGYLSTATVVAETRDDTDSNDDDDGNLDNYGETGLASITVDSNIAISKTLSMGQPDNLFAIGEVVSFDVRVDVIEGIKGSVVVTDVLPMGLSFQGPIAILAPPNISYSGPGTAVEAPAGTLTVDLGNVTNPADNNPANDSLTIQIQALVEDIAGNTNGTVLTNTASLTSDAGSAGPDTQDVVVAEPDLEITKVPSNPFPSLGDEVTFTVTVRHSMASTADAFEVVLTDVIPAGLTYVLGSTTGQAAVNETVPNTPVFDLGSITQGEVQKTFSFNVLVSPSATIGSPITNTIAAAYTSLPGMNPDERSYSGSGDGVVTPSAPATIEADKTVVISVDGSNPGVADPGDELTYTVILTNGSTTTNNVVFTDVLPPETTYVAASLTSSVGGEDDSSAPTLLVDVGTMNPSDVVTITFAVTVNAGTPEGTVISNQGSVDSDETVPEPTDSDGTDSNGDQPTDVVVGGPPPVNAGLYVQKVVSWEDDVDGSGDINEFDQMRYTLIFRNIGDEPLTNVTLTDTIPAGLTYVPASETISSGGDSITVVGSNVSVNIANIGLKGIVTASFAVTIDSFLPSTMTYVNQGTADSDQTGPVLTDSNGDPGDGSQPTVFTAVSDVPGAPLLDLEKRWSLLQDNDGDGLVDPGDRLRYHMVLINTGSAATINLRISDTTPVNTTYVSGSAATSLGIVAGEDPLDINIGTLDPGGVVTMTFDVIVNPGTPNGTILANQAFATADNSVTAPSDDNGDDTDGLNPTLTPVSTDGVTGTPTGLTKTLIATSEADSAGNGVFIGEIATFEIAFSVPAGTLGEVTLFDDLPAGLTYLPDSAQLARTFDTGLLSSTNPGGINSAATGNFINLTDGVDLIENGSQLSVFLGEITNSDNDGNAERYVLSIQTLVANVASNQMGTDLDNQAGLSYANQLGQIQNLTPSSVTLTVIEASLAVTETASPILLLTSGGDVTYTVTITNPSGTNIGPAYNVSVIDMLPAAITGLSVDSIVPAGGVSGITDNSVGTTLDIDAAFFPPDGSLTITFTGTISGPLPDGTTVSTNVNVRWTSLPGTNGTGDVTPGVPGDADGERTGTGVGVNDLVVTDSADVVIGTVNLTKTILNPQPFFAIGDVVQYQVVVAIPSDAIFDDSVFNDILDDGLNYLTGTLSVQVPAMVNLSNNPAEFTVMQDTPVTGQETLGLDWGTVSNSSGATQEITLTYDAVIDNILTNQNNSMLDNLAEYAFTDPGGSGTLSVSEGTTATVGEPHLASVLSITSSLAGLDAGDQVDFELTITNDGTTGSFETILTNLLPSGLENITGLMVSGTTGGTEVPSLTNNGTDWVSTGFDIPVGGTITIQFSTEVAVGVLPGQMIQNTVQAAFDSQDGVNPDARDGSDPGSDQDDDSDLNNYNDEASSPVITIANPVAIDKAFYPDAGVTTYAIGDAFTYRVTLDLVEGTTEDVVVIDTLPDGVVFQSAVAGLGNLGMSTEFMPPAQVVGQVVTFDLGEVVNPGDGDAGNDFITFDIDVILGNAVPNQNGTVLGNNVLVNYTGAGGPMTVDYDADAGTPGIQPLELTVIEPDLNLAKMTKSSLVNVGDEVTFTLTLAHTMASTADAYDIELIDTLPIGLAYVVGSGSLTPVINGRDLIFSIPSLLLTDGSLDITYRVRVESTVLGQPLTNTAVATYTSQPGGNPDERTGEDGPGGLNDYETNEASTTVFPAGPFLTAPKTASLSNDIGSDGVVNPGDELTYTIVLTNSGNAPATGVSFNDLIDANLTLVNGSVTTTQGTIILGNTAGDSTIEINVGDVPSSSSVTITFAVTVNNPFPQGVDTVENQGVFASMEVPEVPTDDPDTPAMDDPTVTPVVDGPQLSVTKVDTVIVNPDGIVGEGDTIEYTIVITNSGDAASGDLTLDDTPDPNTTLVAGSVTTTQGSVTTGNTAGDTSVSVDLGSLAANSSATVTFQVDINQPLPAGINQVANQAVLSEDGTPVVDSDDPDAPGPDDPTVTPLGNTPELVAEKSDAITTDNGMAGVADPGDILTYTVVISNVGSGDADTVTFTDIIGANLSLVVGSVTTSQGVVTSGNTAGDASVGVDIGVIGMGASVTVTFDAQIADPLPPGVTQVANQGLISSPDLPDVPTDDPDLPGEDDPTVTPVGATPRIAASKTDTLLIDDGDGIASAGDTLEYTVTLANIGSADATNVVFDDLPDPNTALMTGTVTTSQGSVILGNTGGDTAVQVAVGTLSIGSSVTITFQVVIDNPLAAGLTYLRNQGVVGSDEIPNVPTDDPDVVGMDDPTDTPLGQQPRLEAIKSDTLVVDAGNDGMAGPGDTLSYATIITNVGNSTATGVVFTDTPDANTALVAGTVMTTQGAVISGNGGTPPVSVAIGAIMPGDSVTVSFRITIDDPLAAGVTLLSNQGVVTSNETPAVLTDDPDTPDVDDPTDTPVGAAPVIEVSKVDTLGVDADGNGVPSPGDTLNYQITVRNTGNTAATGVVFNDTPDSNTGLVPGSIQTTLGSVTSGQAGTPPVTVDIGTLAAGGQVTISFQVTIQLPLANGVVQVVNQGAVSSNELPDVLSDDPSEPGPEDPNVTPVVSAPVLEASKTDVLFDDLGGDGMASAGDTLLYQVSIRNNGNATALDVVFSDTPDPLTALVAGSVQTSQGAVTSGNAGSPPIMVALGDLAPGATAIVSFRVVIDPDIPAKITQVSNQGLVSGDNAVEVSTDDPDTANPDDPTDTPLGTNPVLVATKVDRLSVDADANLVPSAGDTLEYRIRIENTGNGPANNLVFSDTPDVNTALVPGSVQTTLGSVTGGQAGTPPVVVEIATLPAGAEVLITFEVVIDDPLAGGVTMVSNQGVVSSDEVPDVPTDDPDSPDPDDETDTPLGNAPILDAFKVDQLTVDLLGDGAVSPEDTVTYTVTILNVGNAAANEVFFEDTPDAGTTLVAGSIQTSQGQVLTGNDGNPPILVAVGDMAPGAQATITFRVTINNPFSGTTISNQGVVSSDNTPDIDTDDPDTPSVDDPTVTPVVQADLSVTKTALTSPVVAGTNLDYSIVVSNLGPSTATNVVLVDTLPAEVAYVSSTPSQGSSVYDPMTHTLTCELGDMPSGQMVTIDLTVLVLDEGMFTNIVNVRADQFDPDGANNDSDAVVVGMPGIDLELGKTVDNPTPDLNDNVTYTLTLVNLGPDVATGVQVRDQLPAGTSYVADTPSVGSYDEVSGIWSIASLAVNAPATLSIEVQVVGVGAIDNFAEVIAADQTDIDSVPNNGPGEDDDASVGIQVNTLVDLRVTKEVAETYVRPGSVVNYTITVENFGPDTANNVVVNEVLPMGITAINAIPSQGTFDMVTRTWSVGVLQAMDGASLELEAVVDDGVFGDLVNVAIASSDEPDANPSDNSDDASVNSLAPVPTLGPEALVILMIGLLAAAIWLRKRQEGQMPEEGESRS